MNYSNENYNVISNDSINQNAYTEYVTKRIDYDSQIPQYKDAKDTVIKFNDNFNIITSKISDPRKKIEIEQYRKIVRLHQKSHIISNIKSIKCPSTVQNSMTHSSQNTIRSRIKTSSVEIPSKSFNNESTKKDNKSFNLNQYYKVLEKTNISNGQKQAFRRSGSVADGTDAVKETFMARNGVETAKNYDPQIKEYMQDEVMSISGKRNPIKENAYSDVNVSIEKQSQNKLNQSKLRLKREIATSHRIKRKNQLNTSNLEEFQKQSHHHR